ncbi:hypothetical protein [Corynebacterium comes]|uniref:GPI mannosyltransferase 2 n=1 Tax=Corynebacterium comes TaxID=2675218 RepID=A0A6B8VXX1_9CORY|nr:hypothetical protein [Corynebacterium comes]QGU03556.1 hypothetical protein CETAM_01350 [Corynebacterium comes]
MATRDSRLRLLADAAFVFLLGVAFRLFTLGVMARANGDPPAGLLTGWDSKYYLAIAEFGYFEADLNTDVPVHHRTLAFFPGFPALVRLVHQVAGLDMSTAATVVNVVAGVAMTAGVMAIAARMGAGRAGRIGAGILVSSAPMSITFSMPYSEALFGALAFWSVVALMDRRWGTAAGLILLLGFIRLTAVALIGVFGLVVLLQASRDRRAWAWLALTPSALLGYLAWASWHTRDVGGYFGIQEAGWHSGFDFGVATLRWVWMVLTTSGEGGYLLSVGVMVAALVSLVAARGRMPLEVWWFAAAMVATVLLSDGIMHSRPRLLLPAVILLLPWVLWGAEKLPRGWQVAAAAAWVVFGAWFSAYMLAVFEWAI